MIAINPLDITGGAFTSTVPEPDTARGEVEWVDPKLLRYVDLPSSGLYLDGSTKAKNGKIYFVGSTGSVVEIDPSDDSINEFGSYTGFYRACADGVGDFVYAVGATGVVMKIDTVNKTVSTFGSYSNLYWDCVKTGEFIYCIGEGNVMKINTTNDSISFFGPYSGTYTACDIAINGDIYAVGISNKILKISTSDDTITEIDQTGISALFSCTIGENGNIYAVGAYRVMEIRSSDDAISYFGNISGDTIPYDSALSSDGLIYAAGGIAPNAKVISVNTSSRQVFETEGQSSGTALTMSGGGNGVYVGGQSMGDRIAVTGSSYAVEDKVILTSTHREYQAATINKDNPSDGVLKVPPTWIDIGPTNKYAMFDDEVQTATVGASPMVITSTPGIIANGLAMFNVSGASNINVTVNSAASGEVYNKDIDMNNSTNVTDAWTYYFTPIIRIDRFVLLDIPPYNDATITVTLTGSGDISAGVLALGPQISIGVANYNTEIQLLDFSTRERDTFGNFKTVKRAIADLVKFDVTIPKANVSYVRNQFKSLSQIPTVWVGGGGGVDDPTLVYGYYENFVNNISSPSITKSTITIQGVV